MALVPTIASVIPNNWNSVVSANIDTQRALQKLTTLLGPQSVPVFSGLTLTSLTLTGKSGVLKATVGVVAGSAVHADLGSIGANDHHNQVHVLNSSDHTVSGLTTGHVLQALTATTFGFAAVPGLHDAVTLATSADVLLGLTGQQVSLDTQTATYVLAGPVSGAVAAPTFRALASTDIPALAYEKLGDIATHAGLTTGIHGLAITAGQTLTVTAGGTLGSAAYTASTAYETSGAVSAHAALTTGIHGLAITTGQTLTVTAGGTLGSAAYTASSAYEVPLTFSTGLNRATNTVTCTITQYTDALARAAISESVTGLDYTSSTGVLSLTSGYVIPTTTEETNWNAVYGNNHVATTIGGVPLSISGQQVSFNYNTTSLTLDINNKLNTVQDISTAGVIQLAGLSLYTTNNLKLFGLHDASLAHGMTGLAPTDCWLSLQQWITHSGGALLRGMNSTGDYSAFVNEGVFGVTDPSDTVPALLYRGVKKDGTNYRGLAAAETVLQFQNYVTALVTVLGNGNTGFGTITPAEDVHAADTVRADTFFNLNGTDGVTQAASAGTVADPTAIAGGIVTAQTQVTYIADGAHLLSGAVSITTQNGRITSFNLV